MTGVFEVLAADDFETRRAHSRALVLIQKRAQSKFGAFLMAADNKVDHDARLSLIQPELDQVITAACEEVGCEPFVGMKPPFEHLAAGGFCDECKKWKTGPKAGCTCGNGNSVGDDTTEKEVDGESGNAQDLLDDPPAGEKNSAADMGCGRCGEAGVKPGKACSNCGYKGGQKEDPAWGGDKTSNKYIQERDGKWVIIQKGTGKTLSTHDSEEKAEASFRAMEAEKHGKHEGAAEDGLGGKGEPSPKMDKKRWKPNALNESGNLKPIDADKGNRNKTVHQDIIEPADHTKDFLEQTGDNVTHEDLPDDKENAGFNHKKDTESIPTKTWSDKKDQANPVTKDKMAAVDPDKNPIRELINGNFDGFVPQSEVQRAIKAHKS